MHFVSLSTKVVNFLIIMAQRLVGLCFVASPRQNYEYLLQFFSALGEKVSSKNAMQIK